MRFIIPPIGLTSSLFPFCELELALYTPKPCFKSEKCGGRSLFRASTMLPDDYPPEDKDAFFISLFEPQALNSPGGADRALRTIETICHQGESKVAQIVAVLDSRPYLLEYVVSGTLNIFTRP